MSKTFKIVLACALILSLAVAVGFIPAGNPKEEALQKAAALAASGDFRRASASLAPLLDTEEIRALLRQLEA